jgi:hypothetical protein
MCLFVNRMSKFWAANSRPVSGWPLGRRTHRLVMVIGDSLVNQLESIARKKRTSIEDLLKERVIQEWIGKRRIVNQRVFEERSKRPCRTNNRHVRPEPDRENTTDSLR